MSQEENELPPPTKKTSSVGITPKTSAVPLKKETVRITLRANAPGVDAPSATVPLAPRPGPPAPSAPLSPPRPSAGAPTAPGVPPRPAPPISPAGSKTIPLAAAPPRATVPALARPAAAALSTPAAGGTQPLPRTPARLPAVSPSMAVSSAPIRSVSMSDDDAEPDDGPLNIMALVALVASLAMLFFAFASVDAWPLSEGVADTQSKKDEWVKNELPSSFKLPMDHSPFDNKDGEMVTNKYDSKAPVIPGRPSSDGE